MYNVANKLIITTLGSVILTACGSSDHDAAMSLYDQAKAETEAGHYVAALSLLDSIDAAYPSEIDIRRKGMHLRPKAIEGETLKELSVADSLLAVLEIRGNELKQQMEFVENPVEGYYVPKGSGGGDFIGTTGIQARMSPDGNFYIVSSLKKPIKSTAISLSAGGEEARTSTVEYDGERNDRSMGAEVITFMQAECDTLGKFAVSHRGMPMKLNFYGSGTYTIDLPTDQAEALADLYNSAGTVRDYRLAQLNKSRLEKQLDIARSQLARTYSEEKEED